MDDEGLVVLHKQDITNFDLLNLINGATLKSDGLFSIRTVKKWSGKTRAGRPMHTYELQIVTKGLDKYIQQNKVEIKKVIEKKIVTKTKIVKEKAKPEPKAPKERVKLEESSETFNPFG